MKITRREFIALTGKTAVGAVVLSACGIPERELLVASPVTSPEDVGRGQTNWYATTWPEATNAEGVIARVVQGRVNKLAGNRDHPVNRGKQAAFYDAGIQLLYHPDRLKTPLYRRTRSSKFGEISWEKALKVVHDFASDTSVNGASGEPGTNIFVTNPLKGHLGWVLDEFIGLYGGRRITFDPLQQGTLHSVVERMFGTRELPHLDIANAHAIVSFGADWLGGWVSPVQYGVGYGQFRTAPERGYLVHAESRMSVTAAAADLWLPVRPGAEGALAITVANALIEEGLADNSQISTYENWVPSAVRRRYAVADASANTGISPSKIRLAAHTLGTMRPALAFGGGSAAAHTNGSFNLVAIYALNALTDGFGAVGGVRANPEPPLEQVYGKRHGTSIVGWEQEIAQWNAQFVNTAFVRGVDFVHGLPNYLQIKDALSKVQNVVVFASFMNATAAEANLVLPETTFLEEWGTAVPDPAPGYQTVSFQQALAGSGTSADTDSLGFGDTLLRVATRAGRPIGGMDSMRTVVARAASDLRAVANGAGSVRATDDGGFLNGVLQRGGWWNTSATADTSVRPVDATQFQDEPNFSEPPDGNGTELYLIPFMTAGIHDGRLAPTPWGQQVPDPLSTVAWDTWAEINSQYAKQAGIKEGDVLLIRSRHGEIRALAYPHPGVPPNVVGVPIGQGHADNGRYAEGRGSNVLQILTDQKESQSGALAWAATKVKVLKQGGRFKLPKAEGSVEAFPREPGVPVLVVAPNQTAHEAEQENHRLYQQQVYDEQTNH